MQIDTPRYILALDCETSGLVSGKKSLNPACDPKTGERYQAIAWGFAVVEFDTMEVVETLSVKVKFDSSNFTWSDRAAAVHGLTQARLDQAGMSEEDFLVEFCEMVLRYWGTSTPIICLGHNVWFDISFLRDTLDRHGLAVHFSNRVLDTNTLGMVLSSITGSDALFNHFGLPARTTHDPMDDALMALIVAKGYRDMFRSGLAALG